MRSFLKLAILPILFSFLSFSCFAQQDNKTAKEKSPGDKIVQFWFVMLRTGPSQDLDSAAKAKLFVGHMGNMTRLYEEGILKVAGPFGKNDLKWRGIFILDCATKEEAEKHVQTDPAVAAGLFAVDIVPWYGEPIGSFKKGKPEKNN